VEERLSRALDGRDVDGVLACTTPDVTVELVGFGQPSHGRAGLRWLLSELFRRCEQTRYVVYHSRVERGRVVDQVVVGLRARESANPDWIVGVGTVILHTRGGLVTLIRAHLDQKAIAAQWQGSDAIPAASFRSELARAHFDPRELISATVTVTGTPPLPRPPAPRVRRRAPLLIVASLAALAVAGTASYVILSWPGEPPDRAQYQPPAATPTAARNSPQQPAQPLGPSATPVPGGGASLQLSNTVLFERDSAALRPAARRIIQNLARRLRTASGGTVLVIGYTDDLGSAERGLILSKQRAHTVVRLLAAQLGDTQIQLTAEGRGEANPVAPNDTEENRARNRRVEIIYRPA
jgi:outer membrane protein OmpA-like peptidoglycan-associated protein